jgi:hypothetical protein
VFRANAVLNYAFLPMLPCCRPALGSVFTWGTDGMSCTLDMPPRVNSISVARPLAPGTSSHSRSCLSWQRAEFTSSRNK